MKILGLFFALATAIAVWFLDMPGQSGAQEAKSKKAATPANITKIKANGEAGDVAVNGLINTYKVTGRIVNAETRVPVPNIRYNYKDATSAHMLSAALRSRTNDKGEFVFEDVKPGRYTAFAVFDNNSEFYSEAVPFEVTNSDVQGVEVDLRRGSSVIGVAVVAGENGPRMLAQLLHLSVSAVPLGGQGTVGSIAEIAQDGRFCLNGVQPGRA